MNSLPSRRSSALLSHGPELPRPRAQTISAVPAPDSNNLRAVPNSASSRSLSSSNPSSRRHSRTRRDGVPISEDRPNIDRSNKENKQKLSYEELELSLTELQEQYTALTAYLKTVSEKLEREKEAAIAEAAMWQKETETWQKEADLWRHESKARSSEVKRKDVEIEGLKWLILHPMPPLDKSREPSEDDDMSTENGSLAPSTIFSSDHGSIAGIDSPVQHASSRKRSVTIHDFRSSSPVLNE